MLSDDFKNRIDADPWIEDADIDANAEASAYRDQMRALDEKIGQAMSFSVPELKMPELPEIETDNVVSLDAKRSRAPMWLAMAATVLIAAFIGTRIGGPDYGTGPEALAQELHAHVSHAPSALRITTVTVGDQKLNRVVPSTIAEMNHQGGLITFAETCPINGKNVPHLVVQGIHGPVTIILMPDEHIDEPIELNDGDTHGVIIPVGDGPGNGSIAIVGPKNEDLKRIEQDVMNSVTWTQT